MATIQLFQGAVTPRTPVCAVRRELSTIGEVRISTGGGRHFYPASHRHASWQELAGVILHWRRTFNVNLTIQNFVAYATKFCKWIL
jgi:hypothetical protein